MTKIITVTEAARLIKDGSTIAASRIYLVEQKKLELQSKNVLMKRSIQEI